MKILICASEYYPKGSGIANLVYNVKNEFVKLGNEVDILSTENAEINVGCEKIIQTIGGLGIYLFWKKAFKYISKNYNKYDIIWIHNPLFTKKFNKKKIFCTVHTTFNEYAKLYKKFYPKRLLNYYYKIMSLIEKILYKKVDNLHTFTVTSNKTRDELKNLSVKKEMQLISNGVNTSLFKFVKDKKNLRNELGLNEEDKILLFVGRVEPQKKPLQMIKTFRKLNQQTSNLKLLIVGDGPLLNSMKEYCKEHNIINVIFTGRIEYKKVKDYYSASDYFIMSSIYEGQPLSLLEALSSGLVPILSDRPIFSDMVRSIEGGMCLPFKNSTIDSEKIVKFMKEIDLIKESKRMRKFSEENLDWNKIAKEYLYLFDKTKK